MKRPPKPKRASMLHGRLWVEIDGEAAITEAGADLLDQILVSGSLSEAARRLHFSYRRAWLLLEAMNTRWPQPVVKTATGGHHGGGATLTDFGLHVLRAYRDAQLQLEHLLGAAGRAFEPLASGSRGHS